MVTEFKTLKLQRIKIKNKKVFIPENVHKQNLPPYQHKVFAPICNTSITHMVSTFYIVVFRETTTREHTTSVLFLILYSRIVSERNSQFGVRI
jgi:hypothetical protein